MATNMLLFALLALASSLAFASDPSQLQDFCVADQTSPVIVNGFVCKNPSNVTAEDFFFSGIGKPADTQNQLGSNVTLVTVAKLPGLNTLGIMMARIDFAPYGVNPPHIHPRATEVITVVEGSISVGFVTTYPFKLFTKVLNMGDVFVFPRGLIHFQINQRNQRAVAIVGLSSQSPGVITVGNAVFGSKPPISADLLSKAFHLDKNAIDYLQAQTWLYNDH